MRTHDKNMPTTRPRRVPATRAIAAAILPLLLCSCARSPSDGPHTPEGDLRARLGIPPEAKTIIVFGQNAHMDVDWQKTFDGYYKSWVGEILTEARQLTEEQPRAYYSVAEMAYLKHHVEQRPEELAALQAQAKRGALHIVGGGITSPDTVLPETEMLVRDYLLGARFSEDVLGVRPRSAWLPDSFGHSAMAPDLLVAAGFSSVGFARVDGAPTFLQALNHSDVIRPGSDAEWVQKTGGADFLWTGAGGSTIFAHYMSSGLYCEGDNIDYKEDITLPGQDIGVYFGDQTDYTDGQIDSYIAAHRPVTRIPYLFVPIGCDFMRPKKALISYLDGYNQRRYPTTGVWAVAAPFDEFATLAMFHKEELPSLSGELTPYFMGFYGTRAGIKQGVRASARPFFAAETFAVAAGDAGKSALAAAAPSFELLTRTDHHDFVTGTSNDTVAATEQMPLLAQTRADGDQAFAAVVAALAGRIPANPSAVARVLVFNPAAVERSEVVAVAIEAPMPLHALVGQIAFGVEPGLAPKTVRFAVAAMKPLSWRAIDLVPGAMPPAGPVSLKLLDGKGQPTSAALATRVVLANEHVRAEWNRSTGFALTSLQLDGAEALAAPSFVVGDYKDDGGLWRLGHEMPGCSFTAIPPSANEAKSESLTVLAQSGLTAHLAFTTSSATREVWLDAGAAGLSLALTTGAAPGTTRTATFTFSIDKSAPLRTSQGGGYADRVAEKIYTPTFWPAVEWASAGGYALLLRQSTGVRLSTSGQMELMAVRDARQEGCDAEGGVGTDTAQHRIEWSIVAAASPASAARSAQTWNRPLVVTTVAGTGGAPKDLTYDQSLASVEGEGVLTALKPAERGDGVIVRALLLPGPVTIHLSPLLSGRKLARTDTSERDLEELGDAGDTILLDRGRYGAIATVRLH